MLTIVHEVSPDRLKDFCSAVSQFVVAEALWEVECLSPVAAFLARNDFPHSESKPEKIPRTEINLCNCWLSFNPFTHSMIHPFTYSLMNLFIIHQPCMSASLLQTL